MFTLFAATKFGILPLYYIGCSFMGAGTGIGYVCPIKQLLSNFSDHKGLASGLAITGFGAGKFVAAPAIEYLLANFELPYLFLILGCAFLTVMSVCSWLFRPNPAFIMTKKTAIPFKDLVHTKFLTMEYVSIWVMFCINISCGLALIAQEKSLLKYLGFKEIALIMALTAVFNVLGRFGMSTLSDYIGRKGAYHYVCSLSILAAFLCYTEQAWLAICGIMMVEFAYGGNFSVLPSLLAKRFGTSSVSTVHAMTLSGWGIAGIIGPTLGNIFTGNNLFLVLGGLYLFGFTLMEIFVKKGSHQEIKGV
jgi:OFA family oxalate/formate antiporter-like MFS transporter